MKTSQSFGVHFTIRKGREKDGKTAVYASITINKEKVLLKTLRRRGQLGQRTRLCQSKTAHIDIA